jgi:succinate dehydrogenase / fumarate reductase, membrane anchor subunit
VVKREVIGAHYGWGGWLAQRITAVIMLLYTLFFLAVLVGLPSRDYDHWKALWTLPVMRYATMIFVLALAYHAWVGVRNIFMDYVKDTGLRLILYVLVIIALVVYVVWAAQILWG